MAGVGWFNYPGKYLKCTHKTKSDQCPLENFIYIKTNKNECCFSCDIDCSERCDDIRPVNGTVHSACGERCMEVSDKEDVCSDVLKQIELLRILGVQE